MREVNGMRIAFIEHDAYFGNLSRETSMAGVSRDTGAQAVFILAPGKNEADVSDADILQWLDQISPTQERDDG